MKKWIKSIVLASVGGLLLIGGLLSSMIVGVPDKENKIDRINGVIITIIYIAFLCYLTFK